MNVLERVLDGAGRDEVVTMVKEFKNYMHEQPSWTKGSPKGVNNLTTYSEKEKAQGKANMPGHVRAALNWNTLRQANSDNYSQKIVDGMKIVVCKLKPNPLSYTSIAYPTDELRLPQWFIELPFDDAAMEQTLIDEKIDNLLGVLEWDIRGSTNISTTFDDFFSIG